MAYPGVSDTRMQKGKLLSEKYCQSCHALPDPSLLDANSWQDGVLPNMGPWLGIFKHNFRYYPSARQDKNLDSNFYPSTPQLNAEDWQNIINYYVYAAPDSLPPQARKQMINKNLSLLKPNRLCLNMMNLLCLL